MSNQIQCQKKTNTLSEFHQWYYGKVKAVHFITPQQERVIEETFDQTGFDCCMKDN